MTGKAARAVRSASFDPFLNMAMEDSLFRVSGFEARTLFLWVNDPVVVIGRYQNPWLECRLDDMERDGVWLARRQSGGGAVYHDRGNLCVTFMGPRAEFDRRANITLVVGALKDLGVHAQANERNDILVEDRKVSGSAYRETANRSFHHLTLLVDADLSRLSRYLQPSVNAGKAKGVASVRSPVTNLRSVDAGISIDTIEEALACRFGARTELLNAETETAADGNRIAETRERWKSWEWRFGTSPEFTVSLNEESASGRLELEIREGKITEAMECVGEEGKSARVPELIGSRFGSATAALREAARRKAETGDDAGAVRFANYSRRASTI